MTVTGGPVKFAADGDFLRTVRSRVSAKLGSDDLRGDLRLQFKAAAIGLWFVASYWSMLQATEIAASLAFCVSYALAASALGFNVFHDANHGSLSRRPWANILVSSTVSCSLGASRYLWRHKHHVLHHRYTNIHRWDDDVETRGFLRLCPEQPWTPRYRNQHMFFVPLYALNTLEWFFLKDFIQYFSLRQNAHQEIPAMKATDVFEFWACKAIYFATFVVPLFIFLPWWLALTDFLVFHLTLGLAITLVFNIAHEVEPVSFPTPRGDPPTLDDEWAVHQLRTTANFANSNPWLNWFVGGLNFQIEHHLFPSASHTHYPSIAKIVEQTAAEFSVPYLSFDSYAGALKSHVALLRALSVPPPVAS